MNTNKNNISFDFRSMTDNHDTDVSVCINAENVNDEKIVKLLNTFLQAIGSECEVTLNN